MVINDIKYVDLGTFIYGNKKYISLLCLEPNTPKKFLEVMESSNNVTYNDIDEKTADELDGIFNEPVDIIFNDDLGYSKEGSNKNNMIHGMVVKVFNKFLEAPKKSLSITKSNHFSKLKLEAIDKIGKALNVVEKPTLCFENEMSQNVYLNERDKSLLAELNQKLITNFGYVNFEFFYSKLSELRIRYRDSSEDKHLLNHKAYYVSNLNKIVISKEVDLADFKTVFIHESIHAVTAPINNYYKYSFCRIFDEGGTQILAKIFSEKSLADGYNFEVKLCSFIIEIIGDKTFFANFFKHDHGQIFNALASKLGNHDKTFVMLANAEEYIQKKRLLEISDDKTKKIDKLNPERNFTYFYELLLDLYYTSQVKKINSDFYTSGDDIQSIAHFIADTNHFIKQYLSIGRVYNNHETADPMFLIHHQVAMLQKVNLLHSLYCEAHNISLDQIEKFDNGYNPRLFNSISSIANSDVVESYGKIIEIAGKDVIKLMGGTDNNPSFPKIYILDRDRPILMNTKRKSVRLR